MKKKIPCKTCILFAMCVNQKEIKCPIIYEKVVYKDKQILKLVDGGTEFLFNVANYLGKTDWTVYTIGQVVKLYNPPINEQYMKGAIV